MPQKHLFDEVIDDLTAWMQTTRDHLVAGMYQGNRAPFAAAVPATQATAYYRDKLFPDGQRDEAAIDQFIQGRGEQAYARLLLEIDRSRRRELNTAKPPTSRPEPPPEGY